MVWPRRPEIFSTIFTTSISSVTTAVMVCSPWINGSAHSMTAQWLRKTEWTNGSLPAPNRRRQQREAALEISSIWPHGMAGQRDWLWGVADRRRLGKD